MKYDVNGRTKKYTNELPARLIMIIIIIITSIFIFISIY